jgi:hypothetical protein
MNWICYVMLCMIDNVNCIAHALLPWRIVDVESKCCVSSGVWSNSRGSVSSAYSRVYSS